MGGCLCVSVGGCKRVIRRDKWMVQKEYVGAVAVRSEEIN